jgi:hypothetical protein
MRMMRMVRRAVSTTEESSPRLKQLFEGCSVSQS